MKTANVRNNDEKVAEWLEHLENGNEFQMFMASVALGKRGDGQGVDILIHRLQTVPRSTPVLMIAPALARLRDTRAVPALMDMLEHAEEYEEREEVRTRDEMPVIYGRGWRGKLYLTLFGRRIRAQRAGYRETARVTYCRTAAIALGDLGDKRAVEPLRKRLNDPDASVRVSVAHALAQLELA